VLFAYMDELAWLSQEGYLEEKARSAEALRQWRERLLRLILDSSDSSRMAPGAIAELSALAGWTLPDQVTMVAVQPGVPCARPLLDDDVLIEARGAATHLLVPGRFTEARRTMLRHAVPNGRL